jgi:ABC-type polysaccharide/polyol phosphate transport system ATPase subunit
MSGDWVVRLEGVSKEYRLDQERSNLRSLIPGRRGELRGAEIFRALDDVTLEVRQGESVGIVGRNGAGKSTVLKLLAGILQPSEGTVRSRGRMASVIELGVGFDPDLTGRENISFAGDMLGLTRGEIRAHMDWVIAFSEIEEFLDMPVKRYSTGMTARLGFSIATAVPPELLIVDEVLSVGDYQFQRKSFERIRTLHQQGTALVLVSHNLFMLDTLCDRMFLLDHGRVALEGTPRDVIARYIGPSRAQTLTVTEAEPAAGDLEGEEVAELIHDQSPSDVEGEADLMGAAGADISWSNLDRPEIAIDHVEYRTPQDLEGAVAIRSLVISPNRITSNSPIVIRAEIDVIKPTNCLLAVSLYTSDQAVFAEREPGPSEFLKRPGRWVVEVAIPYVPLSAGRFQFRFVILPEDDRNFAQDFPAALAVADADVLIDGDLANRPGVRLPMRWSGAPVGEDLGELH